MNLDKIEQLWKEVMATENIGDDKVSKAKKEIAWKRFVEYAKDHKDESTAFFEALDKVKKEAEEQSKDFEKSQKVYMKGDIIITDPCYIVKDELWHKFCDKWFDNKAGAIEWLKKEYGFKNGIIADTLYGDWGCTTYQVSDVNLTLKQIADGSIIDPSAKEIGGFCADAGLVCVFYLDDCLNHNREEVEELLGKRWCATVIRNFDGYVYLCDIEREYYSDYYKKNMKELERNVVGEGNINFIGTQTSL